MEELQDKILQLIKTDDIKHEVEKVTAKVVKQAVTKMKRHKMYLSQDFSSERHRPALPAARHHLPGLTDSWHSYSLHSLVCHF